MSSTHALHNLYTNKSDIFLASMPACFVGSKEDIHKLQCKINVIAGVGLFTSILSLLGTLSVIAFCLWRRVCFKPQVQPLLHLSVADLLLAIMWISASSAYFANEQLHREGNAFHCFIYQLLAESAHLTTFFLTVNYSVNVYMEMRQRTVWAHLIPDGTRNIESKTQIWIKRSLYILSWLLPFILLLPITVNAKEKFICPCQRCVILIDVPRLEGDLQLKLKEYGYVVFAVVLFFSIGSIIILYGLTLRLYWKAVPGFHTDRERKKLSNIQARITLYVISFLVCWGPALIISILKLTELKKKYDIEKYLLVDLDKFFAVFLLQAILAPLQGFLNSIIYGWSRKAFRRISNNTEPENQSDYNTRYYSYRPMISPEESMEVHHNDFQYDGSTPLAL